MNIKALIPYIGGILLLLLFCIGVIYESVVVTPNDDPRRDDCACSPGIFSQSRLPAGGGTGHQNNTSSLIDDGEDSQGSLQQQPEGRPCSKNYIFGTDINGNDLFYLMFSRVATYSIPVFFMVCVSLSLGSILGVVSGYYLQTKRAFVVSILSDSLGAFPQLLLLVMCCYILDPTLIQLSVLFGIMEATRIGNNIKNKISTLQEEEFIAAAKEIGQSDWRIIYKHILWYNCRELLLIHAIFATAAFIMMELYLGYLNIGNFGAWGEIIGPATRDFTHWWVRYLPSTVVVALLVGLYMLGDAIVAYVQKINKS